MLHKLYLLLSKFRHEEHGAALVEMTLVTPLVILLSAGVFEFSGIIHTKLLLEAGVSDGARYIARCYRSGAAGPCEDAGKNVAVTGASGTARVSNWTTAELSVNWTTVPITVDEDGKQNYRSNADEIYTVTMSTAYPHGTTGLWSYLGFGALTLSASHEERVIGW